MPQIEEPDDGAGGTGWLVARARNGDRAAFAGLVSAHYDFIFRTACKWSGNRSVAEDIAQEVCIKLAAALKTFDGRSAFTSWLYRVTINTVRDHQRQTARQSRNIDALTEVSDDSADPDQEAATTMKELWAAVLELPDQQRDAVMLVYSEEKSHAEAAEIMGVKEGTVSFHIHEAKKTLRGLL